MNFKEIFSELNQVKELVDGWQSEGNVDDIERDLLLDKLKNIYQQIKFFDSGYLKPQIGKSNEICTQNADLNTETCGCQDKQHKAVKSDPQRMATEPMCVVEKQNIPAICACSEVEAECDKPEDFTEKEYSTEQRIKQEEFEIAETIKFEMACDDADKDFTGNNETQPSEQQLFDVNEVQAKPAVDRRIILSLYGDGGNVKQVEKSIQTDLDVQSEAAAESVGAPISDQREEPKPRHMATESRQTKVLGDVLNSGGQIIGDVISHGGQKQNLATKLASDRVTDLHKAIGINDKFLMIRDLFKGNETEYKSAVDELEKFDNLDDALIYIHDNYNWNPNSDGVKLIVELLTRKLS